MLSKSQAFRNFLWDDGSFVFDYVRYDVAKSGHDIADYVDVSWLNNWSQTTLAATVILHFAFPTSMITDKLINLHVPAFINMQVSSEFVIQLTFSPFLDHNFLYNCFYERSLITDFMNAFCHYTFNSNLLLEYYSCFHHITTFLWLFFVIIASAFILYNIKTIQSNYAPKKNFIIFSYLFFLSFLLFFRALSVLWLS